MPPSKSMVRKNILYIVFGVVVLGALWFAYSYLQPDTSEDPQEKAAQKAADEIAKSENPFQADNPLAEVKVDPLEKTKKVLNPFESP